MSNSAKTMVTAAIVCGVALAVLLFLPMAGAVLTLAITAGTMFYHLAMRLAVGGIINVIFHNNIDSSLSLFRQKSFEPRLYKLLRVKKLKKAMPTFFPETFSIKDRNLEKVISETCQSEIVHKTIAVLSFAPLGVIPLFGSAAVFIITSAIAALIDISFALVQRYNRPRLIAANSRLKEKK